MERNTNIGTTNQKSPVAGGSVQNPLAGQLFCAENGGFCEIVSRDDDQIVFRTGRKEAGKKLSTSEWFAWCTWNNARPATEQEVSAYLSEAEISH